MLDTSYGIYQSTVSFFLAFNGWFVYCQSSSSIRPSRKGNESGCVFLEVLNERDRPRKRTHGQKKSKQDMYQFECLYSKKWYPCTVDKIETTYDTSRDLAMRYVCSGPDEGSTTWWDVIPRQRLRIKKGSDAEFPRPKKRKRRRDTLTSYFKGKERKVEPKEPSSAVPSSPCIPNDAPILVVKKTYISKLLSGTKTMEIRGSHSEKSRGTHVYLSQSGTGAIQGRVTFQGSALINAKEWKASFPKHQVDLPALPYKRTHGWTFSDHVRFDQPVPYVVLRGSVCWRKFQPLVAQKKNSPDGTNNWNKRKHAGQQNSRPKRTKSSSTAVRKKNSVETDEPTKENIEKLNELCAVHRVATAQCAWNDVRQKRLNKWYAAIRELSGDFLPILRSQLRRNAEAFPVWTKNWTEEAIEKLDGGLKTFNLKGKSQRSENDWERIASFVSEVTREPVGTTEVQAKRMERKERRKKDNDAVGAFVAEAFSAVKANHDLLPAIGFHFFKDIVANESDELKLVQNCAPVGENGRLGEGGWANTQGGQNREVYTCGIVLKDRESLIPFPAKPIPLPKTSSTLFNKNIRPKLKTLGFSAEDTEMDFLYTNRYKSEKHSFIRFHHDHLTLMGRVIVGVSLKADATLSLVRTCNKKSNCPGNDKDGKIEIKLPRRSMYVMSGLSRYALKHGVIDASHNGDRVSLTFRKCVRLEKNRKQWEEKPPPTNKKLHFPIGYKNS